MLHPLAAANDGGGFPVDIAQLLQFGLLGLIFLCIVFRKYLVPEWTLTQTERRAEADRAEMTKRLEETRAQLQQLQQVFEEQMIPALTRATEVNARYTEELAYIRYTGQKHPMAPPLPNKEGQ